MSTTSASRGSTPAQPKQMSSRLLTMKRASNSISSPTTPTGEPSLKRRKTDHTPDSSVPTTPASEAKHFASRAEIAAALEAEDQRQREAAQKRASLGYGFGQYESQWVLDFSAPVVDNVQGESDSDDPWAETGRQTYGAFKGKKKSATKSPASNGNSLLLSEEELSSDEGEASDDSDTQHSSKKRKANPNLEDDAAAMAALDRVDLSRSSYTKSKGTMAVPKSFQNGRHRDQKRGDKHPKKHKKNKKPAKR